MNTICLQVYGYIWQGHRCAYQYFVAHAPQDAAEARRMAPDFESLIDYRVVNESDDAPRTLRGWRNGMSKRRFSHLVNGD